MTEENSEILASVAPVQDDRWRQLFAMKIWTQAADRSIDDVVRLVRLLHELRVIVPFDWVQWWSPDRYPGGRGLDSAPAADAVRLLASYVRGDRFTDGALIGGLDDGSIAAAVDRLWNWYRWNHGDEGFVDHAEYSADEVYRWSYERRWAPGGTLCWVGLNPATGDRDSGRRPTLRKVVTWAKREGCAAVVVVNLFSFRATDPEALLRTKVDIVGERTDDAIRNASHAAQVTLAAWGANRATRLRSGEAFDLLRSPVCVGLTQKGDRVTPCMSLHPLLSSPSGAADAAGLDVVGCERGETGTVGRHGHLRARHPRP